MLKCFIFRYEVLQENEVTKSNTTDHEQVYGFREILFLFHFKTLKHLNKLGASWMQCIPNRMNKYIEALILSKAYSQDQRMTLSMFKIFRN